MPTFHTRRDRWPARRCGVTVSDDARIEVRDCMFHHCEAASAVSGLSEDREAPPRDAVWWLAVAMPLGCVIAVAVVAVLWDELQVLVRGLLP